MSIFSGIFDVGIGSGTFLSGYLAADGALPNIGFFGAAIAALAVLYLFAFYRPAIQKMASH